MKQTLITLMMAFSAIVANAKDIKTAVFTTKPQMHCENCENKIKGNLKFETGVKEITTNVEKQTVTIKYDADKTSESKLATAFKKIGYEATKMKSDGNKQGACCKDDKKSETKDCCRKTGSNNEKTCCKNQSNSKVKNKSAKNKKATKTDANTSASARQ